MINNKIPYILESDEDGHHYLIPESEKDNFQKWIDACYEGKFAKIKKFDYFNKNKVDLFNLKFYEWEDKL